MADQALVDALRKTEPSEYEKELAALRKARKDAGGLSAVDEAFPDGANFPNAKSFDKTYDAPKKEKPYGPGAIGSIRETIGNAMDTVFKSKKQKQMEEDLSKP